MKPDLIRKEYYKGGLLRLTRFRGRYNVIFYASNGHMSSRSFSSFPLALAYARSIKKSFFNNFKKVVK